MSFSTVLFHISLGTFSILLWEVSICELFCCFVGWENTVARRFTLWSKGSGSVANSTNHKYQCKGRGWFKLSIVLSPFYAPDRMIGTYCFCPVWLFVCLLPTLTFAITFEALEKRRHIWHAFSTNVAFFKWHQGQRPCDLDFDVFPKKFLDFVAAGGIVSVSQTHLDF